MSPTEMERAVRRMLDDSDTWTDFALACHAALGWEGSEEAALSNISHWLRGDGRRHLPAKAILIAIRVTGLDYVSPLLHEEAYQARLERDRERDRKDPIRVEREARRRSA